MFHKMCINTQQEERNNATRLQMRTRKHPSDGHYITFTAASRYHLHHLHHHHLSRMKVIFTCYRDSRRPEPTTETRWKNSSADKHRHPSAAGNTENSFYSATERSESHKPKQTRLILGAVRDFCRWSPHKGARNEMYSAGDPALAYYERAERTAARHWLRD